MRGIFPQVLCKACSVKLAADADPRKGFYTGFLKFGPNILNGKVTERVISEYRVYWSNAAAQLVGSPVAIVSRIRKANTTEVFSCCSDAYEAVLDGDMIPTGASGLTVLPVDINGLVMPVGSYTPVQDAGTAPTPAPAPATTATATEATTTTGPVEISGSLTLQTENPAQFVAESSVAKAVGSGIAYAAHVSPDRVVVSLRAETSLVQLQRARAGKQDPVLVSYTITLPVYEASQTDRVMQELRSQTPSSFEFMLANEIGKLSNGAKYHVKVLSVETPKATPDGTKTTPVSKHHPSTTTKSAAANIWKPLASTLPVILATLVRGVQ